MNELLEDAINEPNSVRKGEKFETFFDNFMDRQEGFVYIDKHCRSEVGEIDYFYRSKLRGHPVWEKYPYFFIECKNWKDPVGSKEIDHFIRLLKAKTLFPCCGVYMTTSSYSPPAFTTMRDARISDKIMMIPIEKNDLPSLIDRGFEVIVQEKCDKIMAKA